MLDRIDKDKNKQLLTEQPQFKVLINDIAKYLQKNPVKGTMFNEFFGIAEGIALMNFKFRNDFSLPQ